MESLARLDANLQALRPGEDWGGSERIRRRARGSASATAPASSRTSPTSTTLAEQLSQSYGGARMDDLDLDKLARQLGDEARGRRPDPAASSSRRCATAATCKRGSDGQLRLTPKAMRQLGKALLRDVAERMSGRQGQRELRQAGAAGELSGATREWEFGDTEPWDVPRTITNAVRPHAPATARPAAGVRLDGRRHRGRRRPRPAPRRASRCSSTRRSRWRWTAAGCR